MEISLLLIKWEIIMMFLKQHHDLNKRQRKSLLISNKNMYFVNNLEILCFMNYLKFNILLLKFVIKTRQKNGLQRNVRPIFKHFY